MKAIHFIVYLAIGVVLGLGVGQFLKSHSGSSQTHPPQGPKNLSLARSPSAATALYGSLPDVEVSDVKGVARQLRELAFAESPARRRAELNRCLVHLAADPNKAPEVIKHVVDSATGANNHRVILSKLYRLWAASDPVAAMDSLGGIEDYDLRYQAMRGALGAWGRDDVKSALAYAKDSSLDVVARRGVGIILADLAEINPQLALSEARLLGDQELERTIHMQAIVSKAEADMGQAWQEIDQVTDPGLQKSLRSAAIDALARKDKVGALSYIDRLHDSEQRRYALMNLFRDWPIADAKEAKKAFLDYPKEALIEGIPFMFGQSMNLADSQEALRFSDSLEGEVRESYLLGVLTEQAMKQPAKTAEIVTDYFKEDDQLRQVYRHLGESWAGLDEHAAAEWVATLPESAARDEAVSSFTKKLFSIDPERALQWAGTIVDAKERERRTGRLMEQWRAQDAEGLATWQARQP